MTSQRKEHGSGARNEKESSQDNVVQFPGQAKEKIATGIDTDALDNIFMRDLVAYQNKDRGLFASQNQHNQDAAQYLLDGYKALSPTRHQQIRAWAKEITGPNKKYKVTTDGDLYKLAEQFLADSDELLNNPLRDKIASRFDMVNYNEESTTAAGLTMITSDEDFRQKVDAYQSKDRPFFKMQRPSNRKAAQALLDIWDPSNPDMHQQMRAWADDVAGINQKYGIDPTGELYKLARSFLDYSDANYYGEILLTATRQRKEFMHAIDELERDETFQDLIKLGKNNKKEADKREQLEKQNEVLLDEFERLQSENTILEDSTTLIRQETAIAQQDNNTLQMQIDDLSRFDEFLMEANDQQKSETSGEHESDQIEIADILADLDEMQRELQEEDEHFDRLASLKIPGDDANENSAPPPSIDKLKARYAKLDRDQPAHMSSHSELVEEAPKPVKQDLEPVGEKRRTNNVHHLSTGSGGYSQLELGQYKENIAEAKGLTYMRSDEDFMDAIKNYQKNAGKRTIFEGKQHSHNRKAAATLLQTAQSSEHKPKEKQQKLLELAEDLAGANQKFKIKRPGKLYQLAKSYLEYRKALKYGKKLQRRDVVEQRDKLESTNTALTAKKAELEKLKDELEKSLKENKSANKELEKEVSETKSKVPKLNEKNQTLQKELDVVSNENETAKSATSDLKSKLKSVFKRGIDLLRSTRVFSRTLSEAREQPTKTAQQDSVVRQATYQYVSKHPDVGQRMITGVGLAEYSKAALTDVIPTYRDNLLAYALRGDKRAAESQALVIEISDKLFQKFKAGGGPNESAQRYNSKLFLSDELNLNELERNLILPKDTKPNVLSRFLSKQSESTHTGADVKLRLTILLVTNIKYVLYKLWQKPDPSEHDNARVEIKNLLVTFKHDAGNLNIEENDPFFKAAFEGIGYQKLMRAADPLPESEHSAENIVSETFTQG